MTSCDAVERTFYDRNDNDTADFLFLPRERCQRNKQRHHWSLLFVDRRDRRRPVAYHYDSFGGTMTMSPPGSQPD